MKIENSKIKIQNSKLEKTHPGIVTAVRDDAVTVQIHSVGACASCQANGKCGFAESKDKTLDIPTAHWQQYHEGQQVSVRISQGKGLLAVWIAYLLPALLLLAVAIGLSLAGLPETLVILATFATLALYILALRLLRHRIDNQFTLTLNPKP